MVGAGLAYPTMHGLVNTNTSGSMQHQYQMKAMEGAAHVSIQAA